MEFSIQIYTRTDQILPYHIQQNLEFEVQFSCSQIKKRRFKKKKVKTNYSATKLHHLPIGHKLAIKDRKHLDHQSTKHYYYEADFKVLIK